MPCSHTEYRWLGILQTQRHIRGPILGVVLLPSLFWTESGPRNVGFSVLKLEQAQNPVDSYPTQRQGVRFPAPTLQVCWLILSRLLLSPHPKSQRPALLVAFCIVGLEQSSLPHCLFASFYHLSPLHPPLPRPPFKHTLCSSFCLWVFSLNTSFVT